MGKSVAIVRAPRNLVTALEWIGDEMAILQSSEDKTLRVWDLRACSMSQQFRARNYLQVSWYLLPGVCDVAHLLQRAV